MNMNITNLDNQMNSQIWIEKYRPCTFQQLIKQENIQYLYNIFLQSNTMFHSLFHGPPGTGKTSTIITICKELYQNEYLNYVLEINSTNDLSDYHLKETILAFCKKQIVPFKLNNHQHNKMIIIDEADNLSDDLQFYLVYCMEKYSSSVSFCLLCNYINAIITQILSRCNIYHFNLIAKKEAIQKLTDICIQENVTINSDTLEQIYNYYDGDLRITITALQGLCTIFSSPTIEHVNANYCPFPEIKIIELMNNILTIQQLDEYIQQIYNFAYPIMYIMKTIHKWFIINMSLELTYQYTNLLVQCENYAYTITNSYFVYQYFFYHLYQIFKKSDKVVTTPSDIFVSI